MVDRQTAPAPCPQRHQRICPQTLNCLKVREQLTVKYRGQLLLSYHMHRVAWPKVNFLAVSSRKSALLTQARRRKFDKIGCKFYFIILYFASHHFECCITLTMCFSFFPQSTAHIEDLLSYVFGANRHIDGTYFSSPALCCAHHEP